jgi:hypothetical protein
MSGSSSFENVNKNAELKERVCTNLGTAMRVRESPEMKLQSGSPDRTGLATPPGPLETWERSYHPLILA